MVAVCCMQICMHRRQGNVLHRVSGWRTIAAHTRAADTVALSPCDPSPKRALCCTQDDTLYRSPGVGKQVLAGIHGEFALGLLFAAFEIIREISGRSTAHPISPALHPYPAIALLTQHPLPFTPTLSIAPRPATSFVQTGYMIRHLGFSQQEAVDKATHLYQTAGTTLAGLVVSGARMGWAEGITLYQLAGIALAGLVVSGARMGWAEGITRYQLAGITLAARWIPRKSFPLPWLPICSCLYRLLSLRRPPTCCLCVQEGGHRIDYEHW